jgi:branched-chain amino acid transport system permease protein
MPEAVSVLLALAVLVARPRWIFGSSREDEDSGVRLRPLSQLPLLARAFDPVQGWRSWRSSLGMDWTSVDPRRSQVVRILVMAAVGMVLLGWPITGLNHDVYGLDFTIGLVYFLLALSLVVLTGWVGQISLAQGAFIAVGGVGTLIGANSLDLPFPLPIVFAALFSIPFSLLIGIPALRLRGLYLAIATLAFGYGASRLVAGNVSLGHATAPVLNLFGWHARTTLEDYYCLFVVSAMVALLCWRVSKTRPGRAFFAVRDSEAVASAYGINTTRTKIVGFVLAGAVAAVAGSVLTYVIGQPGGSYTDIFFSITWLAYAVVAGIGSISGAALAAGVFGLLPLVFTAKVSASSTGSNSQIVAGVLLVMVMIINPGGIASMTRFVRRQATVHGDDPLAEVRPADVVAVGVGQ